VLNMESGVGDRSAQAPKTVGTITKRPGSCLNSAYGGRSKPGRSTPRIGLLPPFLS
jgi:hypothetical protein